MKGPMRVSSGETDLVIACKDESYWLWWLLDFFSNTTIVPILNECNVRETIAWIDVKLSTDIQVLLK